MSPPSMCKCSPILWSSQPPARIAFTINDPCIYFSSMWSFKWPQSRSISLFDGITPLHSQQSPRSGSGYGYWYNSLYALIFLSIARSRFSSRDVISPVKPSTRTHSPVHFWPFKYHIPAFCVIDTPSSPFNRSFVVTVRYPQFVIYSPSDRCSAILFPKRKSPVPSDLVLLFASAFRSWKAPHTCDVIARSLMFFIL